MTMVFRWHQALEASGRLGPACIYDDHVHLLKVIPYAIGYISAFAKQPYLYLYLYTCDYELWCCAVVFQLLRLEWPMDLTLVVLSYWPGSEELVNACKSGSVEEAG